MKLEVDVTSNDLLAFWRSFLHIPQNRVLDPKAGLASFALIVVVIGATFVALLASFAEFHFPTAFITALLGAGILWAILWRQFSRSGIEFPDGVYLGHHVYELNDTSIDRNSAHHQISVQWPGVRSVFETSDHIFLMLDRTFGFIIPKRCVNAVKLLEFLESKMNGQQHLTSE